jgi:hypothetical protein
MKIKITIAGKVVTATLVDNETARDFVSLLPLNLSLNDLFGREKFGNLPPMSVRLCLLSGCSTPSH